MADDLAPAAPLSPSDGLAAVPASPAPEPASAASVPSPAPAPAPTSAPVTPELAPAAPAADAPVQPERSFLSAAIDDPLAKPAEAAAEPAAATDKPDKPAEPTAEPAVAPEAPKPEPISWEYVVPETVSLDAQGALKAKVNFDDEAKAKLNSMFEAFASDPRDKAHQQALVDYHIERLTEQNKQIADFNRNFWNDTRKEWRGKWAADPEIGRSGFETAKSVAARVIDIALRRQDTSPANLAFHRELEEAFETTGAGDNPAIGRLLVRLGRFLDESPPPPPNVNPPADLGKQPGRGRLRDRYSTMP